jgi:hypothetical protein
LDPPLGALKRPGEYTARDWHALIDSVWGPGLPTATKLTVFDTFWNSVDQTWGGFPNMHINWDSLKNVYRPMVAAGVSRGRFAAILTRLVRELNEWHVGVMDTGIDSTMGYFPDLVSWSGYPNYPGFHYRAGVPVINMNIQFWRTNFGAGLTPVNDSTLVVYSVMPGHPLGLQPGDILLGYDRKPWRKAIKELFDAELPFLSSDLCGVRLGATPAASFHTTMISAGMNWGLFDTIDVVKYSTKDTLHFPTSLLAGIVPPYHIATEQLPVNGVPFPDLQGNKLVSSGVIHGTKIGYVYAWDWCGRPQGETRQLFGQAVNELMHTSNVEGLILDFRTNPGGWPDYANEGFKHLFNVDPTSNYGSAYRVPGGGHLDFGIYPPWSTDFFTPTPEIFDHPIAVLTGPLSGSSGDYNAFRLRFHPMVRFFGKPTAGAYTDLSAQAQGGSLGGPFYYRVDNGSVYSHYNNEGLMIHKTFPVDEEVWLTSEGIVKGEDDVVKRALAWINTVSYAHDLRLAQPQRDTLRITTVVKNPLGHSLNVVATLRDGSGALMDTLNLWNDGLHGDGSAGDSLWGSLVVPAKDGLIRGSVRTTDVTSGTTRTLLNVADVTFTRGALIAMDAAEVTIPQLGRTLTRFDTSFVVRNIGWLPDTLSVAVDPGNVEVDTAVSVSPKHFVLTAGDSQKVIFTVRPSLLLYSYYGAQVIVEAKATAGQKKFQKNYTFQVVTSVADEREIPTVYSLEQNYPNPFNPATTIEYAVPGRKDQGIGVSVRIYDVLGREVAVLVNERKTPGRYVLSWDASGLPSGVYLCRMKAGTFVASRKMLLTK